MNCQDANVSLQLALDGEITAAEREALEAHLSECLPCRRMEAWLDELQSSYPAVGSLDAGFAEEVIAAMRGEAVPATAAARTVSPDGAPVLKRAKKSWLRRLWGVARFGLRRKRPAAPKPVRWTTTAAGSMAFGVRSIRPGLQPAVAGPSLATGWIRIAGSSVLAPYRRGW